MARDNLEVDINYSSEGAADGSGQYDAVVKDVGSQRAWSGRGATQGKAAGEAFKKMLGDRRAREYVE